MIISVNSKNNLRFHQQNKFVHPNTFLLRCSVWFSCLVSLSNAHRLARVCEWKHHERSFLRSMQVERFHVATDQHRALFADYFQNQRHTLLASSCCLNLSNHSKFILFLKIHLSEINSSVVSSWFFSYTETFQNTTKFKRKTNQFEFIQNKWFKLQQQIPICQTSLSPLLCRTTQRLITLWNDVFQLELFNSIR